MTALPPPSTVRYEFTGHVVVVTGAARGQGRAHAQAFAEAGADVVLADSCADVDSLEYGLARPDDLAETADLVGAIGGRPPLAQQCDVRDPDQVARLLHATSERFGRIDVLVNNAGIDGIGDIREMTVTAWDDMIATHVRGAFLMARAVAPVMAAQGRGRIITIGSVASFLGLPSRAHYVTAKHALLGLTRALALDLAGSGITANLVCPGAVRSAMNQISALHPGMSEQLGRLSGVWNVLAGEDEDPLLDPATISNAVLWLASDAASFVTGASLVIDAGASIK